MSGAMSSETESESGSSAMSRLTTSTIGVGSTKAGGRQSQGSEGSAKSKGQSSQSSGGPTPTRRQFFLDIVKQSNLSCQSGDYPTAIALYTEALKIDGNNHILYSNRSAAFIKVGQFSRALQDALKARDLNPTWSKPYYRQGIAHNCLSQHPEALAAFSAGLATDPKSSQLLSGLREAALKSPLKDKLEPTFSQLESMKLLKSPFVVISVVGQELLAGGFFSAAVIVLESALKIGTTNVKLKGSVISALSSGYWALNSLDKAIGYMQQDLAIAKSLGDVGGECRAHGNLGAAYFSKNNYKDALTSHRYQLVLAMKCKDSQAAAAALTSLGHVYSAIGDYSNALASHKQCVQLVKQMGDMLQEAREIGNVGAVYLVMGDFDNAIDCHMEHLRIAKILKNKTEEARAYSNLGSSYHYRRNYDQAISFHNHVLQIAQDVHDRTIEARAYAGLGHAARCMGDYQSAKTWHEKQLDMALTTKDKLAEGRACSNLGIVFQLLSDHDAALKLHQAHLSIAINLHDRGGMGRAYGNIGNAYNAMGYYDQAVKYHKQELAISKEVNDRNSEASTHGNLAVAYQAMGMYEKALVHYHSHLNIARELKDASGEACALLNLGNCHSSHGDFAQAVPFYENYLMLSQELSDVEGEAKACHFLGYAHYSLGNFKEAVRYYDQDLSLAKDCQNKTNIARAYCNLGLTHLALGNLDKALECQKLFLAVAHSLKDASSKFRALSNIGNILLKTKKPEEALQIYNKQILLAKASGDRVCEAAAYSAMGMTHRLMKKFDRALGFHTQELNVCQEINDSRGELRAHGNLGAVHMSLGNYTSAIKCYEEMLERAKELKDSSSEAHAYGNLGIARMNIGSYRDAVNYFEKQVHLLDVIQSSSSSNAPNKSDQGSSVSLNPSPASTPSGLIAYVEKGRAYGNLGDCYNALGDNEKAVIQYENGLQISSKMQNPKELDRLLKSIGQCYISSGNYSSAINYFDKRLRLLYSLADHISQSCSDGLQDSPLGDMNLEMLKLQTLEDMGLAHLEMHHFEQATNYFEQQLELAKSLSKNGNNRTMEAGAISNLGKTYHAKGDYDQAMMYHETDLKISQESSNLSGRSRAYCNIGLAHESLGNYEQSLRCQEQHLNLISQIESKASGSASGRASPASVQENFGMTKAVAYSNIGRVHHSLGNNIQAVAYLQQALQLIEKKSFTAIVASNKMREEEAKVRHLLGLALWRHGDLESALVHLEKSTELLETIRSKVGNVGEYSLALFDRQIASYQALQRILVPIGRTDVTLLMAEKARTLANITLQVKACNSNNNSFWQNRASWNTSINTVDALIQRVDRLGAAVLYFSTAGGFLYSWLLIPGRGIVKFHETCINMDEDEDKVDEDDDTEITSMGSLLEKYIMGTREALGIDSGNNGAAYGSMKSLNTAVDDDDSPPADLWSQHLEELGDKLNQDSDKTGFLRMVSRNHRFNCSSYSLSSLFSVGSATGSVKSTSVSRPGSTRGNKQRSAVVWQGPSCLRSLYQMLIAPFEEELGVLDKTCFRELVLVLDNDLLLVPFPILRNSPADEYLCEKFKLTVAPSISSVRLPGKHNGDNTDGLPLVIGNPHLQHEIMEHWGWNDIPRAENEAKMVAEILQCQSLTRNAALKSNIIEEISTATCIHFATHISWKLSAIVLASPPDTDISSNSRDEDDQNDKMDGPNISEYLLTAADILQLKLSAKLVVLSSCHTRDKQGVVTADNVVSLAKAILAAGAMSVLITLWPVPEAASKTFFRAFYSSLLQGSRVSYAMTEAMLTVQHTKHFAHPANWSGYLLIGSDAQLSPKVPLATHALWELLKHPDRSRDALRVTLHLVEKSLQRINNGQSNAMYTTQKSIENKVGNICGWKEILMAVGFRFEPSSNGLPSAVFFPQSDPGERLVKCSSSLQALLGLPAPSIHALSKLLSTPEAGEDVISILRQTIAEMTNKDSDIEKQVEARINVKLWGISGCNELLASLGFDLIEVGENEVILALGKHVNSRVLQLALQAGLALFDPNMGPRNQAGAMFRSLSAESLDFSSDDMSPMISSVHSGAYLPIRQQIAMGKGAFTSYVRSRGEPDGHTNLNIPVSRVDQGELRCLSVHPGKESLNSIRDGNNQHRNMNKPNVNDSPKSYIPAPLMMQRADSSSSGSSMTDWENGLSTVRRRAPPSDVSSTDVAYHLPGSYEMDNDFGILNSVIASDIRKMSNKTQIPQSKVSKSEGSHWTSHTVGSQSTGESNTNKLWLKSRTGGDKSESVGSSSVRKTNVSKIQDRILSQMTQDFSLTDMYQERNKGLGLAPPLSKILMTNRLNLSQIDNIKLVDDGKSDTEGGCMSMDESMSTFDQLSIADESSTESNSKIYPPVPRKRSSIPAGYQGKNLLLKSTMTDNHALDPTGLTPRSKPATTNLSLNLSNLASLEGSSSSSSKSSPSDLSRRDEGDGRSLTDSQYGSYSPSMAQNDLIQSTAAAVYFANKNSVADHSEASGTGHKLATAASVSMLTMSNDSKHQFTTTGNPTASTPVKSILSKSSFATSKTLPALAALDIRQGARPKESIRDKFPENGSRSLRHSPVRAGNRKIPVSLTDFGQKSSEC